MVAIFATFNGSFHRGSADGNSTAARQRVHSVEYQISQRLTDFAFDAGKFRREDFEVRAHFDIDAIGLRNVAPAWLHHGNDLFGKYTQINRLKRLAVLAAA